jgi:nitroreductase
MVRAFSPDPIPAETLDRLLANALKAPSAGNSQGTDLVVLEGPEQTARYWDLTLPEERRASFGWPELLDAPVLVLVVADPARYVARYAEADKAETGLGASADDWPVPYWHVDAGMAAHALLLSAVDAGLGALFFGVFENEVAVRAELGIPDGVDLLGVVALGRPAPDRPGLSAGRPRRTDAVHRGGW